MEIVSYTPVPDDLKAALERFQGALNRDPDPNELKKTPDGKANYLPISFIEMTLDELFFGQWSTENFRWSQCQNEIQGSIDLVVIHPISGMRITKTGAASIQIMVDKVPSNLEGKEKNSWSLDPLNKKPNALQMAFPKLKAECLKNASLGLGKIFGRDINRKFADSHRKIFSGSVKAIESSITNALAAGNTGAAIRLLDSSHINDEEKEALRTKHNLIQFVKA